MNPIGTILTVIFFVLLGAFALAAGIFLIGKIFGFTFLVLRNIFRFIGDEIGDVLRFVGSILASVLFAPLVVLSIVIGRWSASRHYAGSLMDEMRGAGRCVYRFFVANPARLLGLSKALEGVEQRVPEAMAAAPTRDKPRKRVGMFEGYKIIGSLKSGGSGGKLYIAEPDAVKRAVFAKRRLGEVELVVIKVFSLKDGSSLPQIVRESRALDAARSLGLVLEHEMTPDRFYYVMRYVPGESLSVVTQRMHTMSGSAGLDNAHLREAMGYGQDLLVALDTYHNAELWHKDVKPDNIIIDGRGADARAHLVDFGLITPMRSAMTLTTHGTEYFRDPELVRQALRGVKVHQIDGSKFDVYAAGAVLFSVIENSFPAHGGLSQITKRCPEAMRWIVRRAMAEYDRRYPSAAAMLADLRVVMAAADPFTVKPIDLPSVSQGDVAAAERVETEPVPDFGVGVVPEFARRAGSPIPPIPPTPPMPPIPPVPPVPGQRVGRPKTSVIDWWSGRYRVAGAGPVAPQGPRVKRGRRGVVVEAGFGPQGAYANINGERVGRRPLRDPSDRRPASEQIRAARGRAQSRRENAANRINTSRGGRRRHRARREYSNTPGAAVVFAGLLGMAVLMGMGVLGYSLLQGAGPGRAPNAPAVPVPPAVAIGPQSIEIENGQVVVNDRGVTVDAGAPVGAGLARVDARVLLVPMLPTPIEPALTGSITAQLATMRHQGLEIIGDLLPSGQDEASISLTADLRNAIGSTPVDDAELPAKIQRWLGSHDVDGVLLLTGNPGQPGAERAMLVMGKLHTSIPLDERTTRDLLLVLAGNGYTGD